MSQHTATPDVADFIAIGQNRPDADARRRLARFSVAAGAWFLAGAITLWVPNLENYARTADLAVAQWFVGLLILSAAPLYPLLGGVGRWFYRNAPRHAALAVLLSVWQIATAKSGYWIQPYFPPPQSVLDVFVNDRERIWESVRASLILLAFGVALGASAGFLTGLATGWTQRVGYWTRPILRYIGPIPAAGLIPIALFIFPTSFSASVFLVALATWFSVAILTCSGVESVESDYYDVARTLGASQLFLLLRIAIPASLPHVFVGLFMGLGSAISVLVVAEMVGVQAGLGYYLEWSQGWAAYANLFAGLFIMALVFSTLTALLFRVRDLVVVGRKGDVQW